MNFNAFYVLDLGYGLWIQYARFIQDWMDRRRFIVNCRIGSRLNVNNTNFIHKLLI